MCGRYTITVSPEQLAAHFAAAAPSDLIPRFNAAPSQTLPVLLNRGERQIQMLRWGLIPHWAKESKTDLNMINARAESLAEKPTFRDALNKRRCLVLADGFYEWQQTAHGKVPMRMTLKSGQPFAFAGLWDSWTDPNGDPKNESQPIRTFTIVTGAPNAVVKPIHNRMPMMLLPEGEKLWLDNEAGQEAWLSLLQPYPPDLMQAYPVSLRVNSTANDDPALVATVD